MQFARLTSACTSFSEVKTTFFPERTDSSCNSTKSFFFASEVAVSKNEATWKSLMRDVICSLLPSTDFSSFFRFWNFF